MLLHTRIPAALSVISAVALLSGVASVSASAATGPRVIATIPVGSQPWGVAVSPNGAFAYVSNFASNSISVIDLSSWSVTSTIASIAAPLGIAFTPSGTQAYVSASGTGSFARINTTTHTLTQTLSGGLCTSPSNIVANPAGGAMYASCGSNNRGASIDTTSQAVSDTLASVLEALNDITVAPDGGSLVWARGTRVWFQCCGSFVTPTSSPLAIAAVAGLDRVFTANPGDGTVSVIRATAPRTLLSTITIGGSPQDIVISADGSTAYVTDGSGNSLVIVDLATETASSTVAVGSSPEQVALTPDGRYALVANSASNSVSVIDLSVPASGDQVPRAPMQQFARGEDEACDRAPADLVDFPALGAAVHDFGWGMSWAQWPNGGTGGFVCTRQPFYTTTGTWAVR